MLSVIKTRKLQHPWRLATLESMQQRLISTLLWLWLLMIVHTLLIAYFENLVLKDALWLTFTSITTVGYGDFSAQTLYGRITTIVLIYFSGIMLLTLSITQYVEYRVAVSQRKHLGQWVWRGMKNHILIIKTPNFDSERYLQRLVAQVKETPELKELPIQVLTNEFPNGIPNVLREQGVVLYRGDAENVESLKAVNVEQAKYIFVMSEDKRYQYSDSLTFDILDKLKALNTKAYTIAEVVDDSNRDRFFRVGVHSVIRPVRAYPEIVVRAMSSPGTEQVLEDLFDHKGAHPYRVEVEIKSKLWSEIGCEVLSKGFGVPLGYIDHDGKVVTNPAPDNQVFAKALLVLVHYKHIPTLNQIQHCINSL
ncbi:MAG: potassium channel family protein [Pseudomonadota bacterium]